MSAYVDKLSRRLNGGLTTQSGDLAKYYRVAQDAINYAAGLEDEVRQLGIMGNVCTYDTLNEICENCRCKRSKAAIGEKT